MSEKKEVIILSLETSTKVCSIALHKEGALLADQSFHIDKSHSSLLPGIIEDILKWTGHTLSDLSAIAFSSGPGSYTGLRIGLSTAKGLCYALDLPLIQVSALDALAFPLLPVVPEGGLVAPMIDARRMEVYTKLVNANGEELWPIQALVLLEDAFQDFTGQPLYLVGNGAEKCKGFITHPNCRVLGEVAIKAEHTGDIAWSKFLKGEFEDIAYYEPNYLKEFHTKPPVDRLIESRNR